MSAQGQLSMPSSLLGSVQNSLTSLGSLGSLNSWNSFNLNQDQPDLSKSVPATPVGNRRSWSFGLDVKQKDPDSISIASIAEENRADYSDDGVFLKNCFDTASFCFYTISQFLIFGILINI